MTRAEQEQRRKRIDDAVLDILERREIKGSRYGYMCRTHATDEYRRRFGKKEFGAEFDNISPAYWYNLIGASLQRLKNKNKVAMVDGLGRAMSYPRGSSTCWKANKTEAK
jgi:hypothetical protein